MEFPTVKPGGTLEGETLYLTVYPELSLNTDSLYILFYINI